MRSAVSSSSVRDLRGVRRGLLLILWLTLHLMLAFLCWSLRICCLANRIVCWSDVSDSDILTCVVCLTHCVVSRPHSTRAHRWYINDIYSKRNQVSKLSCVCIVHSYETQVLLQANWMINDFVSQNFSIKMFVRHLTPRHLQTGRAYVVRDDNFRSLRWCWRSTWKEWVINRTSACHMQ